MKLKPWRKLASRLSQILINQRTMLEAGVVEQKIAALEEAVQSSAVLPFKRRA